jgi:DNA-directed RNA polymerase subunit F
MEIKETKIASVDDVISILEHDKSELTYEQQLAFQHAQKFAVTDARAKKIRKALEEFGNLSERSIIKIIEIMPKNNMTLRQILASERKSFPDEEVNKILALTKEK